MFDPLLVETERAVVERKRTELICCGKIAKIKTDNLCICKRYNKHTKKHISIQAQAVCDPMLSRRSLWAGGGWSDPTCCGESGSCCCYP